VVISPLPVVAALELAAVVPPASEGSLTLQLHWLLAHA
jgi:hypothetical protein